MRLAHLSYAVLAALVALVAVGAILLTQSANAQPSSSALAPQRPPGAVPVATVCSYAITQATATVVPGTTDTGNHCDDCASTINLPFSYQLYNSSFVTATVTDNGTLQFVGNSTRSANTCLPNVNFSYTIFAHWQDLATLCKNCGIFTSVSGTAPNRIFNIEWRATYGFKSGVEMGFEVRLYEGQEKFDIVYGSVSETGVSATVGVQQDTVFTQYSCNTLGSLTDGLQLTFTGQACGSPTATPSAAGVLVGHVTWQGRAAQPSAAQIMPITLTLKSAVVEVNYPMQVTDQSGFFTTTVNTLPVGTYNWRVKGPSYLATSGTVALGGGTTQKEMGLQLTGDLNGDNLCNAIDFNFMKNNFGQGGAPPIGPAGVGAFGKDNVSTFKRANVPTLPDAPVCSYGVTSGTGVVEPGVDDTGNHCDDCVTSIPLPFDYELYDMTFTQATVSSNGNLQFGSSSPRSANTCLPALDFSYTIFAHWGDLVTNCFKCGIFTSVSGVAPNRVFNIEWRAAFFEGFPVNFELRLYEGQTRFDVVYGSVPSGGAAATVGVQKDQVGSSFTQYECNTVGTLSDGLVLTFTGQACGSPTVTPVPTNTVVPTPCLSQLTICHRTGSTKNPYVQISIDCNGLSKHVGHGDIYPVPEGGCPARLPNPTATPTEPLGPQGSIIGNQKAELAPLSGFMTTQLERRESASPSVGLPPRTGPASPFTPLDIPIFGPNYRANTDTQSPNLAQQEPSIGVNPKNPLNVVVMAKDERAGTNTKHDWIYTSTDGGVTWINQIFPLLTPTAPYSSDPVVNFSDDGICYVTALPYFPIGDEGSPRVGIQIARSFDGGITFEPASEVTNNIGADKEWTWIDNSPGSPFYHRMYVAWVDFNATPVRVRLNYSTDRGLTWTQSSLNQPIWQFPQPVSLPNGHVIVTYRSPMGQNAFVRSIDGGVTYEPPQNIATSVYPQCPPDNFNCSIWRLDPIPSNSVNPNNGTQVLMWADGRDGVSSIYYVRSTDDGVTWSLPGPLAPSEVKGTYQIQPWVHADENGTFHSIWYDNRANPNSSIFNVYYSQSTDDGATWSKPARISSATSDLRIGIPSSYARAAGDYINVTAVRGNVYAAWTDTRSGTGEDIYVVRGTFGGTPTATPTGTPPTATNTHTRTSSPTRTFTPTATATVCGGGQYIITQGSGTIVPGTEDIGNHCSGCVTGINLPFAYRLYDQTFGSVTVSSNGFLEFNSSATGGDNTCLPVKEFDYAILGHWDNLSTDASGGDYGIFTSVSGSAPNRILNIEWRTALSNRRGDVNFEVRLYEGQTRFDVIYGTLAQYGTSATVGVQHGRGINYTQFECNTGGLGQGVMLTFVLPPCGTATPTFTGTPPTATRTSTPTPTVCIRDYGYVTATATIQPGNENTGISCDDCTGIVFFPFPVRFYDQQFTLADVSSNGNIQFTTSNPMPFNPCLPSKELEASVMPHWDDLITDVGSGCPAGGCGVFTSVSGSAPNRVYNIEWRAVRYSNPTMPVHFEVRFYENQDYFDFVYGQVNANGGDATIGVQNDTTRFTQFSCLTPSLATGLLIHWTLEGCAPGTATATATVTHTPTACATCTATPTRTLTRTFTATPTATGTPCGLVVYEGAITLQDPTQAGRHFRDKTRSTCEAPKECPGIAEIALFHYDSYTLTNNNATTQCVIVNVRTKCIGLQFIFAAAYLDSFVPNNICANYLADIGSSPFPNEFMTFEVPAGRTVVIVVSEVTTNQGCPEYSVTVQGMGICGTHTPTPTGTPPTATNTPTRTATPCGYDFVTGTATIVPGTVDTGIHCDDCVASLLLPFPFRLYETDYTSANVSSNGNVQFFTSSHNNLNTCLPAPSLGVALLPIWTDYVTDCSQCGVFTSVTGVAPNRVYNIEWRAGYFKGGGTANFEARLYEGTGVFDFVYGEMADPGNNGTVGVQRAGATAFNQYECNAGGLTPGLLVRGVYQGCGTPTSTPTNTPTSGASHTPLATVTLTRTATATRTPTGSPTRTFTWTPTFTSTPTDTRTITWTPVRTITPANTPTPTPTTCGPTSGYVITQSTGASIVAGTNDSGNHGDDVSTNIPLPFNFSFYGTEFGSVNAISNGNLQFNSANTGWMNACLPDTTMVDLIAPYWDDLRTDEQPGCSAFPSGCGIFTSISGTSPNRIFNIEWRTVYFMNTANSANFEARIYENQSRIDFVYGAVADGGSGATVGVQRGTGSQFTQFECDQPGTITAGLQLAFTQPSCATATRTVSNTHTFTRTPSNTPVRTTTPGNTPTHTPTPTRSPTSGIRPTFTPTPTHTPCPMPFTDVSPSDYFYDAVLYLYCQGVISGYADNTFRPYNTTTRGQVTKIIVLAEGWTVECATQHFTDVPPSHPFYCYVETAYDHGIISGYADGTFRPGNDVTRGQLCKIIVLAEGWQLDCPAPGHFSDVPTNHPFYCHIETAYAHGIISGYADGTFRPGNNATRGQISKIVYEAVTEP